MAIDLLIIQRSKGCQVTQYTNMIEDKNENLWLATNKGACEYNGKTFTNYTTAQGLPDNNIWEIAEDRSRNIIWFGTNMGLAALRNKQTRE